MSQAIELEVPHISYRQLCICLYKKMSFRLLARRYGFDRWHASAAYECRPYKAQVVALANATGSQVVVEIGCGLGEIIARIDGAKRIGFDIAPAVVAAARHLHGRHCAFFTAGVADLNAIIKGVDGQADLLVMVNWPHGIAWSELESRSQAIIQALRIKYVLIDTIKPGVAGYPFHHSWAELTTLGQIEVTMPAIDGVRELHLIRTSCP